MAASRKRWTRLSARRRAESSDRATAWSRRLSPSGSIVSLASSSFVTRESVPEEGLPPDDRRLPAGRVVGLRPGPGPRRTRPAGPGSDRRLDQHVHAGRTTVGHPRLAPHLDGERGVHQGVAQPEQAPGVLGQGVEVELVEVARWPLRGGGRRRRRTPGARPWCWTGAWRSAPPRSRAPNRRRVRGRRSRRVSVVIGRSLSRRRV